MATDTSCFDLILEAIQREGRPIQFRDILNSIKKVKKSIREDTLRTTLSVAVKEGVVKRLKFPKRFSYYCKPDWAEKFDPYWNKK